VTPENPYNPRTREFSCIAVRDLNLNICGCPATHLYRLRKWNVNIERELTFRCENHKLPEESDWEEITQEELADEWEIREVMVT